MPFSDATPIAVPVDLEGAGTHLNNVAAAISGELEALWMNKLEPLQSTWTGRAATYYQGLQQEWNTAAAGLFAPDGVLGQIARAMNVNWGNYSYAEADNTQTWQT
jgi:WXG100 family type VII secretion target